jgi:hypothetical protein
LAGLRTPVVDGPSAGEAISTFRVKTGDGRPS